MSFVLPKGARDFFGFEGNRAFAKRGVVKREGATRFLLFDAYYCCVLLGLDSGRIGDPSHLEGEPFYTQGYPDAYKGQAELMAGLLVDAELRRLMVSVDDREDVERQMVRLLNLTSPSRLSGDGDTLLNQYAVTGFDRLQEEMLEPDNLEDFLVGYHGLWSRVTVEQEV
jgi:hypothetical protein